MMLMHGLTSCFLRQKGFPSVFGLRSFSHREPKNHTMGRRKRHGTGSAATTFSSNCNEEGLNSGASMSDLPSVIVVDILSRLPTRTLVHCRCVCKTWHNILSDPYFNKNRLARAVVSDVMLFIQGYFYLLELGDDSNYVHRPHWPMKFKTKFNLPKKQIELVGSCNGLLCFLDGSSIDTLYICNPVLGEYVTLPKPIREKKVGMVAYMFGFSHATKHYKVLRIKKNCGRTSISKAEVYTFGTDTWRNVGDVPFPHYEKGRSITFNGALHWLIDDLTSSKIIYSFDIDEEQIRTIPHPPEYRDEENFFMRLGVLGNCLSIFVCCGFHLDIWSMKDYGVAEFWTKNRILKTTLPPGMHNYDLCPITLWNGEILFSCFGLCGPLVSYNPEKGSFTKLKVYGTKLRFYGVTYFSSFVSLKDVAGTECLSIMNVK